jgi:serine-type D-Ala-D-Ala endopeptidase (penicillin-binding protein 7)
LERLVGLTAALRVCCACAALFPVLALAADDTTVALERAAPKTDVPLIDCKVAADQPAVLLGWRMWWQTSLAPYRIAAGSLPVADTPVATPPAASLDDSSASLELPALPEGESVEPVLIANLPDLARTLPAPLELPDTTPPGGRGFELADPMWRQADESSSLEWRLLRLRSSAAVVVDQEAGRLLYAKNPEAIMSIASITKLMTAMVVLDSGAPLDELLTIEAADVDVLKGSSSRLRLGTRLTRREMLRLMLMSSENRAAAALARSYPQGKQAFVDAMNAKAKALGMEDTRFLDPTGLNPKNRSTAFDLAVMVNAGYQYPLIRDFTTTSDHRVALARGRHRQELAYHNSNGLVGSERWDIGLSKTGYISEAGRCLVLQATIAAKPVIIVLLDSFGRFTRLADANRIKRWIEGVGTTSISRRRL